MTTFAVTSPTVNLGTHYNISSQPTGFATAVLSRKEGSMISWSNPGWIKQRDAGKSFSLVRKTVTVTPTAYVEPKRNPVRAIYKGTLVVRTPSAGSALATNLGELQTWAGIAYSRMKPTRPAGNLFNPIYELKDVVPSILDLQKRWKNINREVGDLYLSQVFGWIPLINDAQAVYELFNSLEKLKHLDRRIQFLIKNEGKWVPTRVDLRDTSTYSDTGWIDNGTGATLDPVLSGDAYAGPRMRRTETYDSDRIWASARFRWFLSPDVPRLGLKRSLLRRLQGSHLKVADVYRAIPWTWLVDWAVGGARILENTSSGVADKLAADRFFVMRHRHRVITSSATQRMGLVGTPSAQTVFASTRTEYEVKERIRGWPFYPGNPNVLSGSQLAILGALGLSKLG